MNVMLELRLSGLAALLVVTTACDPADAAPQPSRTTDLVAREYLPPELRAQAEQLKRDVATTPTNAANMAQRARILWDWANAYARAGYALDPEVPPAVAWATASDGEGTGAARSTRVGNFIDRAVQQIAFVEANPTGVGTIGSPNLGPFPVDSYQTLDMVYTVGDAKIEEGGGFLVTLTALISEMRYQGDDPTADGYTTITSSNPDVRFEVTSLPVTGIFSGQLRGVDIPRLFFRVSGGALEKGDTVTIRVGDTARGSKGFRFPTPSASAHRCRVWVRLDEGGAVMPLPEVPFQTHGLATTGVRGFAPSIAAVGARLKVSVRSEDQYRNRATGDFPAYRVLANGREIARLTDRSHALHSIETSFATPGVYYLTIVSEDGRIQGEVNPILVEDAPKRLVLWGETHGHSGFAEGSGTVDAYFEFARDDARFDFVTLSEHDLWMDDGEWETLRAATIRFRQPGVFETYLGHEWTVAAGPGGHHNVLFRTPENRRRAERQRAPTLDDLYPLLAAEHDPRDVAVIPHAHAPGSWWQSDPRWESLVEIVSNHGTFEWLGRRYLESGYVMGFIGASDDHIGHPGLRALQPRFGLDMRGGQAAVVAPALTRDAVFDAMKARSTYATNGDRIILDVALNGAGMGQRAPSSATRTLNVRAIGTGPIDKIVVVKNGRDLKVHDFTRRAAVDDARFVELRFWSETDPFARATPSRGPRTWQGALTVEGARIVAARSPDMDNVFTEAVRIKEGDPTTVEFSLRTRGNDRTVLVELDGLSSRTRFAFTSDSPNMESIRHTFSVAAMRDGAETLTRRLGDFVDTVSLRVVEPPVERDRNVELVDDEGRDGDAYWVRVVTTNGGIAWSSPIWVGEPRREMDAASLAQSRDSTEITR